MTDTSREVVVNGIIYNVSRSALDAIMRALKPFEKNSRPVKPIPPPSEKDSKPKKK